MDIKHARIEKRKTKEMYRKRRITCIKKIHELASKCSADVYLVLRRNNYYHVYTSNELDNWPPSKADLEMQYPVPVMMTSHSLDAQTLAKKMADHVSNGEGHESFSRASAAESGEHIETPAKEDNKDDRKLWRSKSV